MFVGVGFSMALIPRKPYNGASCSSISWLKGRGTAKPLVRQFRAIIIFDAGTHQGNRIVNVTPTIGKAPGNAMRPPSHTH